MAGRSASAAKGQGVKQPTLSTTKVGAVGSVGSDRRGHTKGKVPKTIATRVPRKWGK